MQHYSQTLLQYFYQTSHQGVLNTQVPTVYTAQVGSAANQDVLRLFVQIEDGQVVAAKFLASGSVAIIAGGQWLCDYIQQKNVTQLSQITTSVALQALQLPSVKVHIANLLSLAVKNCLGKYLG